MSRTTSTHSGDAPTRLEADPIDLKAYVDRRLNAQGLPTEPNWFEASFEDSWSTAVAEAEDSPA